MRYTGYAGGTAKTADYHTVSMGRTRSCRIGARDLRFLARDVRSAAEGFLSVAHDPTELNRQGPDVGTQYRSAIFFQNDNQKRVATAYHRAARQSQNVQADRSSTQVRALEKFYPAEGYHQDYLARNPRSRIS
jgi:peptide-methionine (S)-S-oxide reductase